MENIRLTENGPIFSRIVQGFWRLLDWQKSENEIIRFLNELIELGITTWDNADIYGDYQCEEVLGKAFKKSGIRRCDIQLVTKCGIKLISKNRPEYTIKSYDTSKNHIIQSVNQSLKNLRTDYIDVLLIHRPDPLMNADEVAEAFLLLKKEGKVKSFGVSNFTVRQFLLLQSRVPFKLVTNQIEFSPFNISAQESGLLEFLQEHRISPMIWSPFGGGRIFTESSEKANNIRKVLVELGSKYNMEPDQVLIAWYLKHPAKLLPILGTGKIKRIMRAVEAMQIDLTREDWFKIWTAAIEKEVP